MLNTLFFSSGQRPERTWSPGVRRDGSGGPHRMIDRSPRITTRTATAQPQHLPPNLNQGLWRVVPHYPTSRPYMLFLSVGSQFCAPASFPQSVALLQDDVSAYYASSLYWSSLAYHHIRATDRTYSVKGQYLVCYA